jgi:hypothetical protein
MRSRLLLFTAVTVILAAFAGRQSAHAGASACSVTAVGKHTRDQLLTAHLSAGCPTSGTAGGALTFSQYPGIHGQSNFVVDYGQRTLALHLPPTLWSAAGWRAHSAVPALAVTVQATPKRHVLGRGKVLIRGGFTAKNGAVVTWTQTVTATPDKITVGSFHVHARFNAGRRMMIQVHQDRSFCARGRVCPYGRKTSTESYVFPAAYVSASVTSGLSFATGNGTLRWTRELPVILLRDAATGRILGRSDLQAVIVVPS